MTMPDWLRTDEHEDTINALEHAAFTSFTLTDEPLNWKWVIIAVHNALQGALVCVMSGTAGVGALNRKSRKEMLEWFEASRTDPNLPSPKERLDAPMTLYQRAKNPEHMREFGGIPLDTTPEQDKDVKSLNTFRKDFVHFAPHGWSIETAGLPRKILNVTIIIETLLLSHPAAKLRLEEKQTERAKEAIATLRKVISSM